MDLQSEVPCVDKETAKKNKAATLRNSEGMSSVQHVRTLEAGLNDVTGDGLKRFKAKKRLHPGDDVDTDEVPFVKRPKLFVRADRERSGKKGAYGLFYGPDAVRGFDSGDTAHDRFNEHWRALAGAEETSSPLSFQ